MRIKIILRIFADKFVDMVRIESLKITFEILQLISEIDEFKGAWIALGNLSPDTLLQLRKVATLESIGSSTRIEGSKMSDIEVGRFLANLKTQKFETRDQQEVAGYAELMTVVFSHFNDIPLTENFIQQLHSILMKFSDKDQWHKGQYKKFPNHVVAVDGLGQVVGVVFETTPPFETPLKMKELVDWTVEKLENKAYHPLLVIAIFVVSLLAIHPFQDGNGRLSRVLTTFLLLKMGYHYSQYSSLEAVIERQKPEYYIALRQTQITLNNTEPDWQAWIVFFLKSLKSQKENLQIKISREQFLLSQMPNMGQTIIEHLQIRGRITLSELHLLTNFNKNTLKKHLENLVKNNQIRRNGVGRGVWYTLI